MTALEGLSALQQKRDKATKSARHVPPPRKPSRAEPAAETKPGTEPKKQSSPRAPSRTAKASPKVQVVAPQVETPPAPETAVPAESAAVADERPLIRATVYLGEDDDVWLEDISAAGQQRRPRVDASRSAVTRFALERLRETMTADEIITLLTARASASTQSVGRKRL